MFRIVFAIVALSLSQKSFAQGSIKGKVVDENSDALEFVNVILFEVVDSSIVKAELSDENGEFTIDAEENYPCILEFRFLGYRDTTIHLTKGGVIGEISLIPQAMELDNITVTAKRPMIMRNKDKMIFNVEGNVMAQGNDVMEILAKSPGVILDYNDNISMNGKSGVRIQLDGKDVHLQGSDLAGYLRGLGSGNIDCIELITNPSARYDAEGNAGIINIVTRQSRYYGTNGSLELSPGYGRYFRWQNNIRLNHRRQGVNVFANYSFAKRRQYMEIVQARRYSEDDRDHTSYLEIQNDFVLPIETHNYAFGADIELGNNFELMARWSASYRKDGSDVRNKIDAFTNELALHSIQNTVTDVDTRWHQNTASISLDKAFENEGNIRLSLDGAMYSNNSDEKYNSSFLSAKGIELYTDLLEGAVEGSFRLGGISLDYNLSLGETSDFEAGWKSTWVQTDNALVYTNTIDGETILNTDLSNHFIYDENINAVYTSYSISKDQWNAQMGVRIEDSNIVGNQLTTDSSFVNEYLNIFPSASLNYSFNDDNVFGLSISRRIDRPGYSQLNPFRFFVNTNTFRSGNPLLRPQYTWSGELSYNLKQRYHLSFNIGYTLDNLNHGIIRDGNKELVLITPLNIDKQWSYAVALSVPIAFSKRWTSSWNLHASWLDFDGFINSYAFNQSTLVAMLNTSHNIETGNGYRLQFGGFVMPPHYISITRVRTISSVNAGVQKTVMNGKGRVSLNVNDIFYDYYPKGRTDFGGLDDAWTSFRDNQVINLSFSLQFGKMSVRSPKSNKSAIQEELNRARVSGNNED